MMQFGKPQQRSNQYENFVPMINIVFLLLIFFMICAQIAPKDPFEVVPPRSNSKVQPPERDTLFIGRDATLYYNDAYNEAAWIALGARSADTPLSLKADTSLPASKLANLIARLKSIGITQVHLVTGSN
jgi:biopolymer transport protein ExbD